MADVLEDGRGGQPSGGAGSEGRDQQGIWRGDRQLDQVRTCRQSHGLELVFVVDLESHRNV